MTNAWDEGPLGSFIELKRGYDLPSHAREDGPYEVVSSSGITGRHAEAKVRGPGVVTGRYGTIGKVFYIDGDFWPLNTTLYVRDFKGNEPRFVSYFLKTVDYTAYTDKAAVPGVNRNHIHQLQVRFPPTSEQITIGVMLKSLDDKIELNERMNETLEGIARAIFKSWFVDFDPVRARMKGRRPYGMDAETTGLFPRSLADSEVGHIPVGWDMRTLSEVARVNAWTLGSKDDLDPILYVDISSVSRGEVSEVTTFERGTEPSRARRRPKHGDTVLSTVRPDRGSYFLCTDPPRNLIVSTGFATITPQGVPWTFLHAAVTRDEVFEYLGHRADGAAYPAVRPFVIEGLQIVVPDRRELLDMYHEFCAPMFSLAHANRQESKTIAALRDTLLPKLISGEIRIRDAEQMTEAAL